MASITSIISLFVLLLVTYCHSIPVGQMYDITTPDHEFTTEKMFVERESKMNMELMNDETTVVSDKKRTSESLDSEERKTTRELEERDEESYKKRTSDKFDKEETKKRTIDEREKDETMKRTADERLDDKRTADEREDDKYTKKRTTDKREDDESYKKRTVDERDDDKREADERREDKLTKKSTTDKREDDESYKKREDDESYKKREDDESYKKRTVDERDDDKREADERREDKLTKKRTTDNREDDESKKREIDERDESKKREIDERDESKKREVDEREKDETKRRVVEDYLYTTMILDSVSEDKHVRGFDDYLYTTMESSSLFNDRAIRGHQEEKDRDRRVNKDDALEMTKIVESSYVEPETSVDSFGKSTGLLRDLKTEERTRTLKSDDLRPIDERSVEEPKVVVPGKMADLVYERMPVKKETKLDEDRTRSIGEKKLPDY